LGRSALRNGDLEVAREAYEQSLEKCELVEDKVMKAHALRGSAQLALQRNEIKQAEGLFQEALEALQKIGDEGCVAGAKKDLAEVMWRRGDFVHAAALLRQSLRSYEMLGIEEGIAEVIGCFAALAVSMESGERAARLLAVSDAYLGAGEFPLSPLLRDEHKRLVTSTRKLLGDQVYERLYAEGAAMGLQEAVVYALEEIPKN
jgi:tetratricopeptide (TPR) repeat protein